MKSCSRLEFVGKNDAQTGERRFDIALLYFGRTRRVVHCVEDAAAYIEVETPAVVQLQVVTVGETEHRSLHVGSPRCTVTAEGDFVEQVEIGGSFAETAYRTVKTEMVSVKCFAGIPPCLESSRPAVGIDGVVTVLPRVEDDRIAFPYGKTAKEGVRAVDSDGSY